MAIRVIHVLREPVPFRPLVQSVDFIKRKTNSGRYLQGYAAIELEEKDFVILPWAVVDSVPDGNRLIVLRSSLLRIAFSQAT